ncbi:hypothetical protein NT01EI_0521 [Edwardsiella ictaluri 93-146]|uniref:Uncharacterized protein n=1 Tax=Edwardsiella ictaluri (strain 93-146) TaxID=634503 RepID=C5BH72_EDWI9|nr:hypothetical protein NT01EI_0521 [Edwardsiella ictaluri 93-146]STP87315.1 Uncharacterised protein [Edwardsiella ictaluri]
MALLGRLAQLEGSRSLALICIRPCIREHTPLDDSLFLSFSIH